MFTILTRRFAVTDSAFSEIVSTDAAEPEKEAVVDNAPETKEAPPDTPAAEEPAKVEEQATESDAVSVMTESAQEALIAVEVEPSTV